MVCVIVDTEKWKLDKEFYNFKYMIYVKSEWERYKRSLERNRLKLKTNIRKHFYDREILRCNENLLKVKDIINNLNN